MNHAPTDFVQDQAIVERELFSPMITLSPDVTGETLPPTVERKTKRTQLAAGEVIVLQETHKTLVFTMVTSSEATCEIFDRVNHRFGNYAQRQFANGVLNNILLVSLSLVGELEFQYLLTGKDGDDWLPNRDQSFVMLGTQIVITVDACERFLA